MAPRSRWLRLHTVLAMVAAGLAISATQLPRAAVPPRYVRLAYAARGLHWRRASRPYLELYAERSAFSPQALERLAGAAERARRADLAFLGVRTDSLTLHVVLVADRAQMARIVGTPVGGSGEPSDGGVIAVATDAIAPALRHEMMHVLSGRYWGSSPERWLWEGVAMYAAGPCHGHDVDEMAAALALEGGLPSLADMRERFDAAGPRGVAMYTAAASLTRYIDTTYGRARLRAVWPRGLDAVPQPLGVSSESLEREWRAHLARVPHPTRWTTILGEVTAHGCE